MSDSLTPKTARFKVVPRGFCGLGETSFICNRLLPSPKLVLPRVNRSWTAPPLQGVLENFPRTISSQAVWVPRAIYSLDNRSESHLSTPAALLLGCLLNILQRPWST